MRVLVLGATGLLGRSLVEEGKSRGFDALGVARRNSDYSLDITDDRRLAALIRQQKPEVILNSAALVNIDECDETPGKAYLINARPAGMLAELARDVGAYFVQISTDHYYTGDKDRKHLESDPLKILNEYARTKYLGEILALQNPEALVIRTNILGFRGWKDLPTFLEWAIGSLENKSKIALYPDYFTSSIDTKQLSRILFDLIEIRPYGVFNVAAREVFSKKDFIVSLASKLGFSLENTTTGSVSELARPRAESLGLNVDKAEKILEYPLPTMGEVLDSIAAIRERMN